MVQCWRGGGGGGDNPKKNKKPDQSDGGWQNQEVFMRGVCTGTGIGLNLRHRFTV